MDRQGVNELFKIAANSLVKDKKAASKAELAKSLGASATKLSEVLAFRSNVGGDMLSEIVQQFGISAEWLLTGAGTMYKSTEDKDESQPKVSPPPKNPQPSSSDLPLLTLQEVSEGNTRSASGAEVHLGPLSEAGAEFAVRVSTSELEPTYKVGDIAGARWVRTDGALQWGRPHVVVVTGQGVIMRRPQPGADADHVCLACEADAYPAIEVARQEIERAAVLIGLARLI